MSQLHTVLRRSVAHLDPSDHDGRERTFTNAREAMIRLLWSYDPPLTPKEIDSKIDEFDAVVATISHEGRAPGTEAGDEAAAEPAEPAATRNPTAPHALAVPKSKIVTAPAAIPFSPTLALPPREPVRKLARFEPLSQIGSPTPLGDAARARSAAPAEMGPSSPDAAVIAALAALDMAAGTDKKPAAKTEPAKTAPAKTEAARTEPAKPAESRARETEDEVGLLDEEVDPFDLVGRDIDGDAEDDEPHADDENRDADDEATDEADDAEVEDSDDDAPSTRDDDDDRPETAEEVLRLHQERFNRRSAPADVAEDERDDERNPDELDPDEPERDSADEDEPDEDLRDEDLRDDDLQDEDPLGEDEPRPTLGERLRNLTDAVSGRMIGIVAGVVLVLVAALGGAAFFLSRSPAPATTVEGAPAAPAAPARPTDIAGVIAESDPAPQNPTPARAEPQPAPPAAGGDMLALETLNLFDGRDPSVFQSRPDNPVRFQGDTQGGFARVSSSINSTGSRITVGRGVYERLAGRTIRIVVVARATSATPAHSLRFAYQNGRSLSPWQDGALGADYAPLSATWTVPKDRGGPETDAVLIEPGIPGDGTAADIKSVRIEVLK